MIGSMTTTSPLYREEQPFRELPPFTLLTVVGALFGWFLIIWATVLDRPLGALVVPPWLALAIGLPLGILLPIVYLRMKMVTSVFPDRIVVDTGMTGRVAFPLADVSALEIRTDDIRGDYSIRNVGAVKNTRIAYVVSTNNGVQLELADGRLFLIGSKEPEALSAAVTNAWRAIHPVAEERA
jgi:hypothetical protein